MPVARARPRRGAASGAWRRLCGTVPLCCPAQANSCAKADGLLLHARMRCRDADGSAGESSPVLPRAFPRPGRADLIPAWRWAKATDRSTSLECQFHLDPVPDGTGKMHHGASCTMMPSASSAVWIPAQASGRTISLGTGPECSHCATSAGASLV